MRKFVIKVFLSAAIPLTIIACIELFLPINTFTFRAWEALSVNLSPVFYGPYYYNADLSMTEEGDLAHHTPYSIKKQVRWRTDAFGFRNDSLCTQPEILLMGDSNIAGSTLCQNETLVNLIKANTDKAIYSIAPYDFYTLIKMFNDKTIAKPKLLIMSYIERNIPVLPPLPAENIKTKLLGMQLNPTMQYIFSQCDKIAKMSGLNYLKARLNKSPSGITQSPVDKNVFFLQGKVAEINFDSASVSQDVKRIASYYDYCKSNGIDFMFVPIPNKETLYYDLVPLKKQPDYLDSLYVELLENGIKTLNSKEIFNKEKSKGVLLFHKDDDHWNKYGANLLAGEICEYLMKSENTKTINNKYSN